MSFFSAIGSFITGIFLTIGSVFGVQSTVQAPVSADESPIQQATQAAQFSSEVSDDVSQPLPAKPVTTSAPAAQATSQTVSGNLPKGSAWQNSVPLGDGKYVTSGPKKGYVYVCHVAEGGGGSQVNGPWIHGSTWNPEEKVRVRGSVAWPQATYGMSVSGSMRTISSNDLPTDHTTGVFPIASGDPAAQYDRNPSSITAHSYSFSLPAHPTARTTPDCIYGQVGIMNNGVLLFDGFDALYRDALAHELQDDHDGHPNNSGYHKHGFISDIKDFSVSQTVGFAFDGFPITGPKLPNGNYLTTADLDECHGITSTITLDGKQVSIYHYVLTQDFPYSVSCFRGTSYEPKPGGGGQQSSAQNMTTQGAALGSGPPQEAITACNGKSTNAACSISTPQGTLSGTCRIPPNSSLACVPN